MKVIMKYYWFIGMFLKFHSNQAFEGCEHPGQPIGGWLYPDKELYDIYENVTIKCNEENYLVGNKLNMCMENGSWMYNTSFCGVDVAKGSKVKYNIDQDKYLIKPEMYNMTDGDLQSSYSLTKGNYNLGFFVNLSHETLTVRIYYNGIIENLTVKQNSTGSFIVCRENPDSGIHNVMKQLTCTAQIPNDVCAPPIYLEFTFDVPENGKLDIHELVAYHEQGRECGSPLVNNGCVFDKVEFGLYYYKAKFGYYFNNNNKFKCENGTWNAPPPICLSSYKTNNKCGKPPRPAHSKLYQTRSDEIYEIGSLVSTLCDEGYFMTGSRVFTCKKYSTHTTWNPQESFCDRNLLYKSKNQAHLRKSELVFKSIERFTDGDISTCKEIMSRIDVRWRNLVRVRLLSLTVKYELFDINVESFNMDSEIRVFYSSLAENEKQGTCDLVFKETNKQGNKNAHVLECKLDLLQPTNGLELLIWARKRKTFAMCEIQVIQDMPCKTYEKVKNCIVTEYFGKNDLAIYYKAEDGYLVNGSNFKICKSTGSWSPLDPTSCVAVANQERLKSVNEELQCVPKVELGIATGCIIVAIIFVLILFTTFLFINSRYDIQYRYRRFK